MLGCKCAAYTPGCPAAVGWSDGTCTCCLWSVRSVLCTFLLRLAQQRLNPQLFCSLLQQLWGGGFIFCSGLSLVVCACMQSAGQHNPAHSASAAASVSSMLAHQLWRSAVPSAVGQFEVVRHLGRMHRLCALYYCIVCGGERSKEANSIVCYFGCSLWPEHRKARCSAASVVGLWSIIVAAVKHRALT